MNSPRGHPVLSCSFHVEGCRGGRHCQRDRSDLRYGGANVHILSLGSKARPGDGQVVVIVGQIPEVELSRTISCRGLGESAGRVLKLNLGA